MLSFRRLTIAPKLLVIVGALTSVLLMIGFAIVITQATDSVSRLSQDSADAQADTISKQLIGEIGIIDATVRSMSESLSTLHQSDIHDRDIAMSILKPNINASPLALASWFFEEPLSFDGKAMLGHLGSTPSGAFMPYWIKRDGHIAMEPDTEPGLYSADYYKLARESGKAVITEPYNYQTGGRTITMTSVTRPVFSRGKVIGVAGIDIALTNISDRLAKMHPFGTGRVMLLSKTGLWVAHPDAAARMKPYADAHRSEVMRALDMDETRHFVLSSPDGDIVRTIRPISLPSLHTTWAVVFDVPAAALGAPAKQLAWQLIVVGLLILGAVIGGLFQAIRVIIGRPLGTLSATVDRLAKGETLPLPHLDREDEIGTLARAANVFRQTSEERASADARSAAEQKRVVETVSHHLEALAGGDLTMAISTDFPPAYAALKGNFNTALGSLSRLIGSVMESASTIRVGSGEIAQASEDLARRTEASAASLTETGSAIARMTARLQETADAADRTVNRADGAIATVASGREIAKETVQAMTRVSESAKNIDDVVEGLDKIAFQTRVLAMNAAVEAGRAGDAGRGFAVVADLVSALAMRAEEEAGRASEQLSTIQRDIGAAVEMVQKVDGALAGISDDVGEVHGLLGQMATDNQEQSTTFTQINVAIVTMDQSTQQNAAMVEQTSAAARNLSAEVRSMSARAKNFTVVSDLSACRSDRHIDLDLGDRVKTRT